MIFTQSVELISFLKLLKILFLKGIHKSLYEILKKKKVTKMCPKFHLKVIS